MGKNVVGRQIAKIRYQRGWSQAVLARELQKLGWDVSRSSISKIESRSRQVKDWQIMFLVRALAITHESLYPDVTPGSNFGGQMAKMVKAQRTECVACH